MSLTGTPFFILTILLVIGTVVALVLVWNRIPGPTPARIAARVGLTVFSQVAAVIMVLVYVNNSMGPFYDTWGSLFGENAEVQLTADGGGKGGGNGGGKGGGSGTTGASAQKLTFTKYNSTVLQAKAVGPESRIKANIFVWLPPQYNDPAFAHTDFPVLELLPGTPGSPKTWFGTMHADQAMIKLMGEGRAKPMILVSAEMNMYGGSKDSGCADLPGSYQTATWLGRDVPAIMKQNFRVANDPAKWAIAGYSAGGYCAANIAVHHPESFRAAVSMSGYNAPIAPVVTKDPALAAANNPLLLLRNAVTQPDLQLMTMGTLQDSGTVADATALFKALHKPGHSRVVTLTKGDHDTGTFITEMTPALIWVSELIGG